MRLVAGAVGATLVGLGLAVAPTPAPPEVLVPSAPEVEVSCYSVYGLVRDLAATGGWIGLGWGPADAGTPSISQVAELPTVTVQTPLLDHTRAWNWVIEVHTSDGGLAWLRSGTTTPCSDQVPPSVMPVKPDQWLWCAAVAGEVAMPNEAGVRYSATGDRWIAELQPGYEWEPNVLESGWQLDGTSLDAPSPRLFLKASVILVPPTDCNALRDESGELTFKPWEEQWVEPSATAPPAADPVADSAAASGTGEARTTADSTSPIRPSIPATPTPSAPPSSTTLSATEPTTVPTTVPTTAPRAAPTPSTAPTPTPSPEPRAATRMATSTGLGIAGGAAGLGVLAAAGAFVYRLRRRDVPTDGADDEPAPDDLAAPSEAPDDLTTLDETPDDSAPNETPDDPAPDAD